MLSLSPFSHHPSMMMAYQILTKGRQNGRNQTIKRKKDCFSAKTEWNLMTEAQRSQRSMECWNTFTYIFAKCWASSLKCVWAEPDRFYLLCAKSNMKHMSTVSCCRRKWRDWEQRRTIERMFETKNKGSETCTCVLCMMYQTSGSREKHQSSKLLFKIKLILEKKLSAKS